jgi:hypothetical protein
MSDSFFSPLFSLSYQISPILLTGGLATDVPGGLLPIITFTEGVSLITGLLAGSFPTSLDQFFAQFMVIPSGKLISQQIAHYPFANQQVAANAVITDPLTVSVRMDCPANTPGSYVSKLAVLTALQAALSAHNAAGGLYTIATPSFIYTNCILKELTDISGGSSAQVQYQWQFDFEQPLVTLQASQQAYSALLNKINGGTQIPSGAAAWSGPAVSASPATGGGVGTIVGANTQGALSGVASPVTAGPGFGTPLPAAAASNISQQMALVGATL